MDTSAEKLMALRTRLADPFYDVPGLTERGRECARRVAKGEPVTAIHKELGISKVVVYDHLNGAAAAIGQHLGIEITARDIAAVAWRILESEAAA